MKNLFWIAFYKLKFGKDYSNRMKNAMAMGRYIDASSVGNLSHFYNSDGEQIRGWHRRVRFASSVKEQHPLITKYQ